MRQPISKREQPRIIHQLAETGSWESTRRHTRVRLIRTATLFGGRIQYAVCFNRHWKEAEAETVAEALEMVNRLLSSSPHREPSRWP